MNTEFGEPIHQILYSFLPYLSKTGFQNRGFNFSSGYDWNANSVIPTEYFVFGLNIPGDLVITAINQDDVRVKKIIHIVTLGGLI